MENVSQSFETDVIEASYSIPVLVDFWAGRWGPFRMLGQVLCRMLGPVLERQAQQANGKWRLVKMNVDEHPEVVQEYGIRRIPAVKLFHKGEVVAEFVGPLSEPAVARWLGENLPSKSKQTLEAARVAFESGERDEARKYRRPFSMALY